MAKTIHNTKNKKENVEDANLTGTFISVLGLGLFIVITWVSVYFLYLERF